MDRVKRLEMGVNRDLGCDCIDVSQDRRKTDLEYGTTRKLNL